MKSNETQMVIRLIKTLEMTNYELLTLCPRLSSQYQASVKATLDTAKQALKDARELFAEHLK